MKLSENTISVLKNFASINSGIVLKPGKFQRTMSIDKCVLAEVTLEEEIPTTFGIYDLPQFLGNLSALDHPEIDIQDNVAKIKDGVVNMNYFSCSPNLIATPPEKNLEMKNADVTFKLTNDMLQKLLRLASMNDLSNLTVVGKNGKLLIKAHERANDTSNSATIELGDYEGADFEKSFKTENLKMLPNDYEVSLNLASFALFENKSKNIRYFVSFEGK